jgi:hypothetical protein
VCNASPNFPAKKLIEWIVGGISHLKNLQVFCCVIKHYENCFYDKIPISKKAPYIHEHPS